MDIIKQISGENNSINHVDADIKKYLFALMERTII